MPNIQPIKSVNVAGTVHPLDSVFTVLSGISTLAGSSSSSSYKSVRWYVSDVSGITEPYDGMKLAVKVPLAGVRTAGAVLSINGNADASYHPLAYNVNTPLTTHFPVNSIKMFTYDATQSMDCYLASGTKTTVTGVWKAESNYDSNSNSLGYQVRTNNAIYKNGASTACPRYQILVETANGLEAFTSTSNQTGTKKTQLLPKYIPNGAIRYYASTASVAAGYNFVATVLWQQYQGINLKYSFNISTITNNSPCFIKMTRNDDGTLSPVYSATSGGHPLVFALPTTKDGYYYTYLGRTYTSSSVVYLELELSNPTFYYDGGVRVYDGTYFYDWAKASTKPTYTASEVGALPDTTTIPTKTSELTNDRGYITGINSSMVTSALGYTPGTSNFSGSYNDLTNKPTIPTKSSWNYDDSYVKYTAAQSLTDAQKTQARTNIGAGTSSLSIGTTDSTAAAGNHTHNTTLATDSGAPTITMAPDTTYKLSTGGTNVVFKTPSDAYKIVETLRKGSEADTAVGYYKIATINHESWNFCDFCMLVKNSYAGLTYNTIFNCSCSDSNVDLRDFKLEIISGTDISNKLAYLYTYDSSNNLIKIEVFIHATRFEHPMCYIINARPGQQLVIPTQDEFNKATPDKPDGTTMTGHAKPDNRRLLNHDLGVMLDNTTTDNGWKMFNSTYTGYLLQSVRFNANSPAWGVGNYGAGIIFGGADTKGVISTGYGSPLIKFAGGNGSGPVWWIGLTGTSGTTYNLDDKQDKISALGSMSRPIYFSADGEASTCSTYAGGTKVTLNGIGKPGMDATIYAPTTAGTSGYSLKSNGSGKEPRWAKSRNVSVGSTITSGAKNCSSVSFLIGNSSTDSHLTKGLWYYSGTHGVFIVYVVNEITTSGSAKTEYISGYVSSQITSNKYITLVEL